MRWSCPYCTWTFSFGGDLDSHMEREHAELITITDASWLYCNIMECDWKTTEGQNALARHRYKHSRPEQKENIMNDQMEQVWRSKDGKCVGSKAEVEAYLATLSPLGKMRFPYRAQLCALIAADEQVLGDYYDKSHGEIKALVAFANLAELYPVVIDAWNRDQPTWRKIEYLPDFYVKLQKLLLAYEEALKLVPR